MLTMHFTFQLLSVLLEESRGAGKTSMLVSLLSILLHLGYKLLVCAPTNAAISEIETRLFGISSYHGIQWISHPTIFNSKMVVMGILDITYTL